MEIKYILFYEIKKAWNQGQSLAPPYITLGLQILQIITNRSPEVVVWYTID